MILYTLLNHKQELNWSVASTIKISIFSLLYTANTLYNFLLCRNRHSPQRFFKSLSVVRFLSLGQLQYQVFSMGLGSVDRSGHGNKGRLVSVNHLVLYQAYWEEYFLVGILRSSRQQLTTMIKSVGASFLFQISQQFVFRRLW